MNKVVIITLSLILFISLLSLKAQTVIGIQKLPQNYTEEDAIKNGDVVIDNSQKVYNLNKLTRFISNIKNEEKDKIRITALSIEGDPIIYYLNYSGKNIVLTVDNTRDKFGVGDIIEYKVKEVKKEVKQGIVIYYVVFKDKKFGNHILIYQDKNENQALGNAIY
ncbi:MAG TPA: DUF4362 domain-containing protein [Clostridiaceae bacterium]